MIKVDQNFNPHPHPNPTDLLLNKTVLLNKTINTLNFRDIVSLFFHAVENVSSPTSSIKINNSEQKKLFTQFYENFENNITYQKNFGWPKLSYIRNDHSRRFEIFTPTLYHPSKNILVLLLRLLHIEEFKEAEMLANGVDYHRILSHKIKIDDQYNCTHISFVRLFEILKQYITHYVNMYSNGMMYESRLGMAILNQM